MCIMLATMWSFFGLTRFIHLAPSLCPSGVKVQKLLPLFLTADFSAKDVNIFELFCQTSCSCSAISACRSIFQRNKRGLRQKRRDNFEKRSQSGQIIAQCRRLIRYPVDHLGSRRLCWQREPSDISYRFRLSLLFPNFCDLTVQCKARAGREARRA
jgi:hypothetical protein